jgi:hypothetical protein
MGAAGKKRLYVDIDARLRDEIEETAKLHHQSLTAYVEEALREKQARESGETVERQTLPLIREIVQTELRKTAAQLRTDVREDVQHDVLNEMKVLGRRSDDRIIALVLKAVRCAGIGHWLLYRWIAHREGGDAAMKWFEQARDQTGKDLARRTGPASESTNEP